MEIGRPLSLSLTDQREILTRLLPLLRENSADLILFGSRARGDARAASDIDLAVQAEYPIPPAQLAAAREALEDSNVPFSMDLLDYATLPAAMRQVVDREGIAWPA